MRKNSPFEWTFPIPFVMVWALCFCMVRPVAAEDAGKGEDVQLQIQELRLAREAAEKRAVELEAALAKARRDLRQLRSRYADVYLQSQERNRRLETLELQAAHLLVDRQALAKGDTASEALRTLEDVLQAHAALTTRIQAFQTYLNSVLAVLEPSDALRREITARYEALKRAAEQTVKPLSRVAGRGKRNLEAGTCRVLAVNDDLQVVVLDAGYADGVRQGSRWQITREDQVVARLRVIELRANMSAALLSDGRLENIGLGSVVTPDRR